jgi:hypothetical protein
MSSTQQAALGAFKELLSTLAHECWQGHAGALVHVEIHLQLAAHPQLEATHTGYLTIITGMAIRDAVLTMARLVDKHRDAEHFGRLVKMVTDDATIFPASTCDEAKAWALEDQTWLADDALIQKVRAVRDKALAHREHGVTPDEINAEFGFTPRQLLDLYDDLLRRLNRYAGALDDVEWGAMTAHDTGIDDMFTLLQRGVEMQSLRRAARTNRTAYDAVALAASLAHDASAQIPALRASASD